MAGSGANQTLQPARGLIENDGAAKCLDHVIIRVEEPWPESPETSRRDRICGRKQACGRPLADLDNKNQR
jgi:hypothetical protein